MDCQSPDTCALNSEGKPVCINKCLEVNCQNGGVCNENFGQCDCPFGYIGDECEIQSAPDCQINLTAILEITNFNENPFQIWVLGEFETIIESNTTYSMVLPENVYDIYYIQDSGFIKEPIDGYFIERLNFCEYKIKVIP